MPATCTTSTITTGNMIWTLWMDSSTGATNTWQLWCNDTTLPTTSANVTVFNPPLWQPRQRSPEEIQRDLQEAERRRRQAAAYEVELEKARIEAHCLLDSILDDMQKKCLKEKDWFLVIGRSGKIYRLRRGRIGNIDMIAPDGNVIGRFCIHPGQHLPNADDLVAQKLHLETDDDGLIRRANRHLVNPEVIDLPKYMRRAA